MKQDSGTAVSASVDNRVSLRHTTGCLFDGRCAAKALLVTLIIVGGAFATGLLFTYVQPLEGLPYIENRAEPSIVRKLRPVMEKPRTKDCRDTMAMELEAPEDLTLGSAVQVLASKGAGGRPKHRNTHR
ncbi:unnamed protein product [Cylindrotheca closterium]|uniref:Uncharacterized protein n=1 Tax=Cylindrotheca closterium TaxID=2856 RepID=A0AAD2CM69_9STRA|nr:unnamed protein product [Cylindrotheca closterium]